MNGVELESFPFNSIVDDREYEAEVFRNYFGKFLTTGVYFGLFNDYGDYSMKVMPDTGLNVKVVKGCGLIKGADFNLKNDTLLSIEMPIGKNRNDMVVVRFDDTLEERKTKLYIKQGTDTEFAGLERSIDVYEICLAKVVVQDRALSVTIDDITDTRRDNELCGIVTSLIDIDIQNVLDDITVKKDKFFTDLEITTEEEKAEFWQRLEVWFQSVQDVLDENTAGHLLNLINSNLEKINNNAQLINTKANKKKVYNIVIGTTGWSDTVPYTQTIEVEGILATDEPTVDLLQSDDIETAKKEIEEFAKIDRVDSLENNIILKCYDEKPIVSLNTRIEVIY